MVRVVEGSLKFKLGRSELKRQRVSAMVAWVPRPLWVTLPPSSQVL